ncbi:MAG: hypothetical protein FWE97_03355 [Dehalococcoidia bacterium]|nr:hypothetical protein [Dehalococcoidia bacterium]
MTKAQQKRNIKGGMICAARHGSAYMAALGRKGGSVPKRKVYQPQIIDEGRKPASYSELLKAVFSKSNLREGGLRQSRSGYPVKVS